MMNISSPASTSCCLKKHVSSSMVGLGSSSSSSSLKMRGFYDKGQLEYYKTSVRIRCGSDNMKVKVEKKKKKKKKEVKLLKGLSKDLADFYGMGFGLNDGYYQQKQENGDGDGLADQLKFKMMSEAAELLLEQLKQVRAEDKELKKKMKMEEKKKKKEEQKLAMSGPCLESSSSSSSSSESSDSEPDNEMVANLSRLNRSLQLPPPASDCTLSEVKAVENGATSLSFTAVAEENVVSRLSNRLNQEKKRLGAELEGMVGKKIEVCMGGKCKKSGAATLMEEFERVVGLNDEIVVSGCKCMGKCKNGPNVRVVNSPSYGAMPVPAAGNPLCLGVGVEDVGLIISNFFGDESHQEIVGIPAGAM